MSSSQSTTGKLPGVRGAAVFYLLAFAISWAIWGAQIVLPQLAEWDLILIIVGAYGPLIAALVLSRIAGGPRGAWHWFRSVSGVRRQWRWILLAGLVLPLLIALAHLVLYRVLVGPFTLSVDPPWYWAVSTSPLAILLLFWMSSAVEEFGWQGFAMPRLTADMHPLIACLIHGILWGTWHLPLYYIAGWSGGSQEIWLLYAITITLAPTMFWLTQSAAGSVIPAVVFHAATNHYTSLFMEQGEFPVFVEPLVTYFDEIKVAIYLVVALVLVVYTRGWLGMKPRATEEGTRLIEAT